MFTEMQSQIATSSAIIARALAGKEGEMMRLAAMDGTSLERTTFCASAPVEEACRAVRDATFSAIEYVNERTAAASAVAQTVHLLPEREKLTSHWSVNDQHTMEANEHLLGVQEKRCVPDDEWDAFEDKRHNSIHKAYLELRKVVSLLDDAMLKSSDPGNLIATLEVIEGDVVESGRSFLSEVEKVMLCLTDMSSDMEWNADFRGEWSITETIDRGVTATAFTPVMVGPNWDYAAEGIGAADYPKNGVYEIGRAHV